MTFEAAVQYAHDYDGPGARVVHGGADVVDAAQRGYQIGTAVGSIVPVFGTAVGATVGAIVGGLGELFDQIDLFGPGRRWEKVRDPWGVRMMPVGWTPNGKFAWERQAGIGDWVFRTRRAYEDGASRSETLFALEQQAGRWMTADARAALLKDAWGWYRKEAAILGSASDVAKLRDKAQDSKGFHDLQKIVGKSHEKMSILAAASLLSLLRKDYGVSQPQGIRLVLGAFPGAGQAFNLSAATERLKHARAVYLAGASVPRLPLTAKRDELADCIKAAKAYVGRQKGGDAPAPERKHKVKLVQREHEAAPEPKRKVRLVRRDDDDDDDAPARPTLVRRPQERPAMAAQDDPALHLVAVQRQAALTPAGYSRTLRLGPWVFIVSHVGSQWHVRATLTDADGVHTGTATIDEKVLQAGLRVAARAGRDLVGDDGGPVDIVGAARKIAPGHVLLRATKRAHNERKAKLVVRKHGKKKLVRREVRYSPRYGLPPFPINAYHG